MDTLIRAERGRWMQMVVADRDASDAALEGGRETCLGIYIPTGLCAYRRESDANDPLSESYVEVYRDFGEDAELHSEEEGGWVNEGEGEDRSGLDPAFGVYRDRLTVRRKKGVGWALHALTGWMGRCETTRYLRPYLPNYSPSYLVSPPFRRCVYMYICLPVCLSNTS